MEASKLPDVGSAVTVIWPERSEAIAMAVGLAAKVKVPPVPEPPEQLEEKLTAAEIWFAIEGLPTACT